MSTTKYWVAGHITTFFQIDDEKEDLLSKGSCGAGFNINRGVITEVIETPNDEFKIFINDKQIESGFNEIPKTALTLLNNQLSQIDRNFTIKYTFEVPIGSGFGTSAAGSLGTIFALNDYFNLKLDSLSIWQLAHKIEIINKTGLGDILGLYSHSNFEMRVKAGAPGVGEVLALNFDIKNYDLYTLTLGPLSKKLILSDVEKRSIISSSGKSTLLELQKNCNFLNFNNLSLKFANTINLQSKELKEIINGFKEPFLASQILLGDSLYFFVPKNEFNPEFNPKLLSYSVVKEELTNRPVKKL